MKISTKTRYGLRMLTYLALHQDRPIIQLKDIAKEQNISIKYLEQIVSLLRPLKIFEVTRGARGGYRLSRDPKTIALHEIFYLLEGGGEFAPSCEEPECTSFFWKSFQTVINEFLYKTTLQDIVANYTHKANMYYI